MAHRTDGPDHVGNRFTDGNPLIPQPGTVIEEDWLNMVQEEICNAVEGLGGVLDKARENQLVERLYATFELKNAAVNGISDLKQTVNTWTAKNIFQVDGDGWQALSLLTGWSDDAQSGLYYSPAYRVDSFGRVWFRGRAKTTTGAQFIALLPAAIRDENVGSIWVGVVGGTASGSLNPAAFQGQITGGHSTMTSPYRDRLYVNPITYPAETTYSVDLGGFGPYYHP
jgi:hypothetical protein